MVIAKPLYMDTSNRFFLAKSLTLASYMDHVKQVFLGEANKIMDYTTIVRQLST